jgi:hypothetical protein
LESGLILLPEAHVGISYTQDLTFSGGTISEGMTFDYFGSLPPGLSASKVDPNIVRISGIPTTIGTYLYMYCGVSDSLGEKSFGFTVHVVS